MLALYLLSALIMFLLEYFVLLRLYRRPKNIETISLIVAPLMIIVGLWITLFVQQYFQITPNRINPVVLFVVFVLLELPLSLYGYDLTPNASVVERLIVAGVFATASVMIAKAFV